MKSVGLLGFDFIAALAPKVDCEHGEVIAYEADQFVAPTTPHTIALDIRLGSQTLRVDVTINGALGERFLIDTGSPVPLMPFDYFQRRHLEALIDRGGGGDARQLHFTGVGGAFETKPYQLDSMRLGTGEFKQFFAYAVRSRAAYGGDQDGIVGVAFLQFFHVYLEPNAFGAFYASCKSRAVVTAPCCATTRRTMAMIVSIGFTPLACGKSDASATSRFS